MKYFYKGVIAIINLAMSLLLAAGVGGGIWYIFDQLKHQGTIWVGW